MNRRALLIATAAGASVLAGCQSKEDCPPLLHVDAETGTTIERSEDEVTPYEQLSEERKQEFTTSLEDGSVELDETTDAWVSTEYVEYQGDYYSTAVAVC